MAKIPLSREFKSKTFESYPKFKMATGEKARVCLIDQDPDVVFVHVYRMPVVVNGVVQKEQRQGKRGPYEVDKTEFVGQWICSGEYETVSAKTVDEENCPQCAKVLEKPSMYQPPVRKFGQHVLRYKTQPGSFNLAQPFQAELLAWVYSESRYDELADLSEEYGEMRNRDLNINCISGDFQNLQVQVAAQCEWTQDDQRKAFVADVFKNNKASSMENLIARTPSAADLAMNFDTVEGRHSLIGRESAPSADETVGLGESDLDNMFASPQKTPAPEWAQPSAGEGYAPPAAEQSSPAPAAPEASAEDDEPQDFDSFLKSL